MSSIDAEALYRELLSQIRAAYGESLTQAGAPVLADRGGRELPVAARFTGGVVDVPADATLVLTQRDDGTLAFATEARTD